MSTNFRCFMHEVKNKLNAISGMARLIQISDDAKEIKEYATIIENNVRYIAEIDRDYTDFSRLGKSTLRMSIVDITNMIRSIVAELEDMKNQYQISFELELTRARAYTDVNKLRQALVNLITNAIKYSKLGGVVFISCYTDSKMPGVVILIRDNGVGMNNAEVAQIGKPFYRVKKVDRPGSGLGMCVTKKIALLLNMGIRIKSQPNIGTEVKLTIKHIVG